MNKELTEMTNEELWQLFPVVLSQYDENWANDYLNEEQLLIQIIGSENLERISHIGSTSVPGLLAKPTIDILLKIKNDVNAGDIVSVLTDKGYIYSHQPKKPNPHMMFLKGYTIKGFDKHVYHIHVRYRGDWDELYFRDYLKIHSDITKEYGNLKVQLIQKYKHDRDAYTEAKTEFVKKIIKMGREEFADRYNN